MVAVIGSFQSLFQILEMRMIPPNLTTLYKSPEKDFLTALSENFQQP